MLPILTSVFLQKTAEHALIQMQLQNLDSCIVSLEEQISNIENGHLDDVLEHVVNYYVPLDYADVCSTCKFPEKPVLEKMPPRIQTQEVKRLVERKADVNRSGGSATQYQQQYAGGLQSRQQGYSSNDPSSTQSNLSGGGVVGGYGGFNSSSSSTENTKHGSSKERNEKKNALPEKERPKIILLVNSDHSNANKKNKQPSSNPAQQPSPVPGGQNIYAGQSSQQQGAQSVQSYAGYNYPGVQIYNPNIGAVAGGYPQMTGQYPGASDLIALNEQLVAAASGQFTLTQEQLIAYNQQYNLMMQPMQMQMLLQQGSGDVSLSQMQAQYLNASQLMMSQQMPLTEGIGGPSPVVVDPSAQSFQSVQFDQNVEGQFTHFSTEKTREVAESSVAIVDVHSVVEPQVVAQVESAKQLSSTDDTCSSAVLDASDSEPFVETAPARDENLVEVEEPKSQGVPYDISSPEGPTAENIVVVESTPRRESSRAKRKRLDDDPVVPAITELEVQSPRNSVEDSAASKKEATKQLSASTSGPSRKSSRLSRDNPMPDSEPESEQEKVSVPPAQPMRELSKRKSRGEVVVEEPELEEEVIVTTAPLRESSRRKSKAEPVEEEILVSSAPLRESRPKRGAVTDTATKNLASSAPPATSPPTAAAPAETRRSTRRQS